MKFNHKQQSLPTAIVVGNGTNALGVVRSLGRHGVPVLSIVDHPDAIPLRSRFGVKQVWPAIAGELFVEQLESLAATSSGPTPILFMTEEKTVTTVSEARTRVQAVTRIVLPEHQRLMSLMHKQRFQSLAEQTGALIPRVVHLKCEADLSKLIDLRFPCVLKPAYKHHGYGIRFKKAYVIKSAHEAALLYEEIAPVLADIVVQEWVEGGDDDIYFNLQYIGEDGRLVVSFPGRKIRSWPPRIGGTASCLPAWEHAEELEKLTYSFFRKVDFVGMGSMEFKRDRHDGRFYMIEPTVARTDFQEEVATINGVNLPLAAYRYEAGLLQIEKPSPSSMRIWRDTVIDRWSQVAQGENAELDRYPTCDSLWRWDDPGPWFQSIQQRIKWRWRALTDRASRLSQS